MSDQTPNNPIGVRFLRSVGKGITTLRGNLGQTPTSSGATFNPFAEQEDPRAMNPDDAMSALNTRGLSTPQGTHRITDITGNANLQDISTLGGEDLSEIREEPQEEEAHDADANAHDAPHEEHHDSRAGGHGDDNNDQPEDNGPGDDKPAEDDDARLAREDWELDQLVAIYALLGMKIINDPDPIPKALMYNGYTNIYDLLAITEQDLNDIEVFDVNDKPIVFGRAYKNAILALPSYQYHNHVTDWRNVLKRDFDSWRRANPTLRGPVSSRGELLDPPQKTPSEPAASTGAAIPTDFAREFATAFARAMPKPATSADIAHAISRAVPPTPSGATVVTTASGHPTVTESFNKNMKRSVSDYKAFKDKNQWLKWNRELHAMGAVHDINEVFDKTYVPATPEERELFANKKKFAFAIFTTTLVESSAAEVLRQYSDPKDKATYGDAQAVYARLEELMSGGVTSTINMQEIGKKIDEMKLDHSWTSTTESFINKMAKLISSHKSVDIDNTCDDEYYIKKFKLALSYDAEFRQHFTTHDLNQSQLSDMCTKLKVTLPKETYAEFLKRVQDQAKIIDSANKHANTSRKVAVNQTKTTTRNNDKKTTQGTKHSDYLSKEDYAKLTKEEKQELYQKRKQKNAKKANTTSTSTTKDSEKKKEETKETKPGSVVRDLMSAHSSTKGEEDDEWITVGKTKYRKCNVTYRVNRVNVKTPGSLVDSGANGGLS